MGHRRTKQDRKINDNLSKMVMTKKKSKYKREKNMEWDLKKEQDESKTN